MAGYNEIKGLRVKYLSADPSNGEDGQVWYNNALGQLRVQGLGIRAYSSTTNLPSARTVSSQGGTSQTAGLSIGGNAPPYINNTEHFNGLGWTAGGAYPVSRGYLGAAGSETATLAVGGNSYPSAANTYNGTSWTSVTASPTGYEASRYAGTSASGVLVAGGTSAGAYPTSSHEWTGSSWTAGGSLPSPKNYGSAIAGTQTAAFSAGGAYPQKNTTSNYDGSSWTTSGNLPTNTYNTMGNSVGGQTTGVATGGNATSFPSFAPEVYHYNGSVWSQDVAAPAPYTNTGASFGPQSAHVFAGGPAGASQSASTVEYNITAGTIVPATWSSGGAIPGSGRQGYGVGTGTQTASIIAGGPPTTTQNQFYDGSAWTNLASIPSGVTNSQGFGDSEELLMAGGNTGAPYSALTYVYSRPGNSWTAVSSPGNINTARALGAGCGALSTAGIIAGGDIPGYTTATESWNGSTWTTVNALPTATGNGVGSCGTQTAGLIFSGQNPGDATAEETYEWDGTNWTSGGNRNIGVRAVRGGAGTQTAALTFGGWLDPGGSVYTEGYDGTSWSTRPNMAGAAANNFQTGTQTAALRAGGTDGPGYTAVEEFNEASVTGSANSITTS